MAWAKAKEDFWKGLEQALGPSASIVLHQAASLARGSDSAHAGTAAACFSAVLSGREGEAAAWLHQRSLVLRHGPATLLLDAARRNAQYAAHATTSLTHWQHALPPAPQVVPALSALPTILRLGPEPAAPAASDPAPAVAALPPAHAAPDRATVLLAQRPDGSIQLLLLCAPLEAPPATMAALIARKVQRSRPIVLAAQRQLLKRDSKQRLTSKPALAAAIASLLASKSRHPMAQRRILVEAALEHAEAVLRPAWTKRRAAVQERNAAVLAEHIAAKQHWLQQRAKAQRERLAALKADDVEAYMRLAEGSKNSAIDRLLAGTDACLRRLAQRLQAAGAGKALQPGGPSAAPDSSAEAHRAEGAAADGGTCGGQDLTALKESSEAWNRLAASFDVDVAAAPALLTGGTLREYQMRGLRWMLSLHSHALNGILADEMGLGKTVQVIALVAHLLQQGGCTSEGDGYSGRPFLIAAPSSVLPNWEREFAAFAPSIKVVSYRGPAAERQELFERRMRRRTRGPGAGTLPFHVALTSYEFLMGKADRPRLASLPWEYIVVDEGHRLKNSACKLNCELRCYRTQHRLLLTGTPLQNGLNELWALLNFLMPDVFDSADDFDGWFGGAARQARGGAPCSESAREPGEGDEDEDAVHAALLSEEEVLLVTSRLHQVLRPFMLRRLKESVATELPPKVEHILTCPPAPYQRALFALMERQLATPGGVRGVSNTVMELRVICNHPLLSRLHAAGAEAALPRHPLPAEVRLCGKLELLDRVLLKLRAGGHRALLFCTMTRPLDVIEQHLEWRGLPYLRLDGDTPAAERGALVQEFNRPGSPALVFLLSVRSGGVGLNLQAADTVIFYDTDWNPQMDLQAQARAHRIGQQREVLVLRLVTAGSIEERVVAVAAEKRSVADRSITGGFFDGRTSATERQRFLLELLRSGEGGREGSGAGGRDNDDDGAGRLSDAALDGMLARSQEELVLFEAEDTRLNQAELQAWASAGEAPRNQAAGMGQRGDGQRAEAAYQRLASSEEIRGLVEAAEEQATPVDCDAGKEFGRGKRSRGEVEYGQ